MLIHGYGHTETINHVLLLLTDLFSPMLTRSIPQHGIIKRDVGKKINKLHTKKKIIHGETGSTWGYNF